MSACVLRSAGVLLHQMTYHDELLRDFGADPLRKRGVLAPLKELLAPYQSSDYRDVVSGTFRRNRAQASVQSSLDEKHAPIA